MEEAQLGIFFADFCNRHDVTIGAPSGTFSFWVSFPISANYTTLHNHPGVIITQKSSSSPRKLCFFYPVWAHKQHLTWLSSMVLLVTSMVTTTSMSGSRGHRESVVGFVVGLWIICTVTAGVACTSKDAAPLGVDLEWSLGSETTGAKCTNLELNRATAGQEGPQDHPWVMKWSLEFHT